MQMKKCVTTYEISQSLIWNNVEAAREKEKENAIFDILF